MVAHVFALPCSLRWLGIVLGLDVSRLARSLARSRLECPAHIQIEQRNEAVILPLCGEVG